ncbi:MAG: hypothetical protein LQ348_002838 [Seirophora lacunosa]|nr:MAG: hypothetical protein LQ348_002838 [Seirophora lacunosa]
MAYSHDFRAGSTNPRRALNRLDDKGVRLYYQAQRQAKEQEHAGLIESSTPREHSEAIDRWEPPVEYWLCLKQPKSKGPPPSRKSRKVIRRETEDLLRGGTGIETMWEVAEVGWPYRYLGPGCNICASYLSECRNRKLIDREKALLAETLASHGRSAAQALMDGAMNKWAQEREEQLKADEWIVLSGSSSDAEWESQYSDYESDWTAIDL